MSQDFKIVIPARLSSSRLPRKVLLDIAGKPLVQHVYERCVQVGASEVIVATDSKKLLMLCVVLRRMLCDDIIMPQDRPRCRGRSLCKAGQPETRL